MGALAWAFEGEETLKPGSGLRPVSAPSVDAAARPLAWSRAPVADGRVVLPGGFACDVPEKGRVLTVEMDRGYLLHLERVDDGALVTVEPPPEVEAPVDDARLARLAVESRENATGNDTLDKKAASSRRLRQAWVYRRAFERLAEPWPGEGGPVVPVRWVTLSYEGRVHVPGVGTLDVDDAGSRFSAADGRRVTVRRVGQGDGWAPAGAVEIIVAPPPAEVTVVERPVGRTRVKTSPKCVPL